MSRSPYFFVEKFDLNRKKYEIQHPIVWNYNHTKQELADLFPYNGCHDLFSIVEGNSRGNFPSMHGIHHGLPNDVSEEIKIAYDECCFNIDTEKRYTPRVHWFSYADMYIYCLENPEVPDYDAIDEENTSSESVMMPIPLKTLMDRVNAFLEVTNEFGWIDDYSLIRIVYWIE